MKVAQTTFGKCKLRAWAFAGVFCLAMAGASQVSLAAQTQEKANASVAGQQAESDRRSAAYYEFAMGRLYEAYYDSTSQSEYAGQAIEHYKKAQELDPREEVISERLAELYAKTQRLRDAVLEAQEILQRDPDNLPARRLLARIYRRTLGDLNPGMRQRETVGRAIEQYREILRIDPGDTEAGLWLARLYRLNNEHEKAEEVLRRLVAADPENEQALEQLVQLLLDQGKTAEGIALLEPATSRSQSPRLVSLLGEAYFRAREYARAEELFRKAVEADPRNPEPLRGLAQALLQQDKHEAAAESLRRLAELEPENPENYLRLGQTYRQLGKLELAEENLVRARELAPANVEVIYQEAMLYEVQGRFQDAIRVLSDAVAAVKARPDRLVSADRTLAVLYEHLGRLYQEVENFPAAIYSYQEMLKLGAEEEKRARMLLVDAYRAAREMDRAIEESKKILELYPEEQGWRISHATLLGEKGETDEAAAALRRELEGTSEPRNVYLSLAQVFERGRRYAEAEESAQKALSLSSLPAEKEIGWLLLAAIYERQRKHELAENHFKKILEVNPRNAVALNNYGYMLADRGVRVEEAVGMIQRALDADQHNGAYLDSLGWAYFKMNRLAEAEKYLRRAAERMGRSPTVREHLGDLFYRTGQIAQAAAEWEKALAEWRRTLPTELEPEKVSALEKKLERVKQRLAQTAAPEAKPQ